MPSNAGASAVGADPLQAIGLRKAYGGALAIDGVDLSIPLGSFTALVGPNGAGKSTLIRTWLGFERPSSGRVATWGLDPWRDRGSTLPHVGYVPQTPVLYRGLTVTDHLDLAARYRPAFDRRHADATLSELGISRSARAESLSGGQAAQLCLAIAMATMAEVLLLDEPLASLDPLARREFLDLLLDDVRTRGRTVVMSSHVVADIARGADRLVVLGVGRKMLDENIVDALAQHFVDSAEPASSCTRVATIGDETGGTARVFRSPGSVPPTGSARPARLEEVVLAYLSAGRLPPRREGAG
jgi:ABC-2 type transport system ATP-binding protein